MKFLVADDMYTNRLRIVTLLKNMGHTFDEAVNGQDAIEKIVANNYDVVLLDIEMPIMNGFETVQHIRNNLDAGKKNVPVVIISSHGSLSYFTDYKTYGYSCVLKKPFTQEKLEEVLEKLNLTDIS